MFIDLNAYKELKCLHVSISLYSGPQFPSCKKQLEKRVWVWAPESMGGSGGGGHYSYKDAEVGLFCSTFLTQFLRVAW